MGHAALQAQDYSSAVTKVLDFNNTNPEFFPSAQAPHRTDVTQVGNDLWFLTERGGVYGVGGVFKYNLTSGDLTMVSSLGGFTGGMEGWESGSDPRGSILNFGDGYGYFSNFDRGINDTGAISRVNFSTGVVEDIFYFDPAPGVATGRQPGNTPTYVKVGNENRLYFTAGSGGSNYLYNTTPSATNNNGGTIGMLSWQDGDDATNATFTLVKEWGSPAKGVDNDGSQPFAGGVIVGNYYYTTTFTGGGNYGSGMSNGTGVLARVNIQTHEYEMLVNFDPNDSENPTLFGGTTPIYDESANALYFTTTGSANVPGGIQKYDLDTGTMSNVFAFTVGEYDELGRNPYGDLTLFEDKLYFMTLSGGEHGGGVIGMFDLTTDTYITLYDLETGTGSFGGGTRGGFSIVLEEDGLEYLYGLLTRGGQHNHGAMIRIDPRMDMIPEGSVALLLLVAGGFLSGSRRRQA